MKALSFDSKDFTYQEKIKILKCFFFFGQCTNYNYYCSNNICKNCGVRWSFLGILENVQKQNNKVNSFNCKLKSQSEKPEFIYNNFKLL